MKNFLKILCMNLLLLGSVPCKGDTEGGNPVRYVPEAFGKVKLGWRENRMNPCSPGYPEDLVEMNSLSINVPESVIYRAGHPPTVSVIPLCVTYSVSLRRVYKYHSVSDKMLYVKDLDTQEEYSAVVEEILPHEYLVPDPFYEEHQRELRKKVEEARQYEDHELGEGLAGANYINVNLLEYIDLPWQPGRYEVRMAFLGLESNRIVMEIIEER